ncbi:YhgE/Pip domain-containing protein [[Clostridium] cellulosi]
MSKAKKTIKCTALVIGVIIIPLFYSFFYLKAFWDPYNTLDKVPVAVVNNDKGAEIDGENRNIGKEISDELKKDGSLKFVFTDEADATNGVNDEKYYASIILPSDLSERIASASTSNKREGIIQYAVNEKHNYIASQILKIAINRIEEKARGSVDGKVVSILADKLNEVPSKLNELSDGLTQLSDGSQQLLDGTGKAYDGQKQLNSGIEDLNSGLIKLYSGSTTLANGQKTLNSGVLSLRSGLGTMYNGSTALVNGQKSLNSGILDLRSGLGTLYNGSTALTTGLKSLDSGISSATSGVGQLSAAVSGGNGLSTLTSGVKQLNDGAQALLDNFKYTGSTDPSSMTITDAVTQVDNGVQSLYNMMKYTGTTDESKMTVTDGAVNINNGMQQLKNGTSEYTSAVNSTIYTLIKDNPNSATVLSNYAAQLQALMSQSDEYKAAHQSEIQGLANLVNLYNAALNSSDAATFSQTLISAAQADPTKASIVSKGAELNSGAAMLATKTNTFANSLNNSTVQGQLAALSSGSTLLRSQFYDGGAFKSGVTSLATGTQQLYSGVSSLGKLTSAIDAFTNGLAQLKNGSTQLVNGATQLQNGLASAYSGSAALSSGSSQLLNGATQLQNGLASAYSGSATLSSGSSQLLNGATQLQNGLASASSGASKLADGSSQLVSASKEINSGASQLNDGINTAKDGVNDSINDANSQLDTTKGLDSFAKTPVSVKTTELNPIPNYGSAFAPYFMSLSLWVGGLLIFFGIYLDADCRIKVLSRYSDKKLLRVGAFILIGIAQALTLAVIVQFALGLSISNVAAFYFSCILVSVVFISIIEFLIVHLGDIGKFLSLAFLVLQLTSNGGTFPMETVPKFFNDIYPYMPMTYSVKLFKECTSNFNMSKAWGDIAILLAIFAVFTGLTILLSLTKKAKNAISEKLQAEN